MARSERASSERDLDRTVFFSDAVFAIAMTLLAISLHIPAETRDADVADQLHKAVPSILTYVLSFAVIGIYWLGHHRMFRYIERIDTGLLIINLAVLCGVAFVPFPTEVLGSHGDTTAAVVFYAVSVGLVGALSAVLWTYASHGYRLVGSDTPRSLVDGALWRGMLPPLVFFVSIPIAFFDPGLAELFWILLIPVQLVDRPRRGAAA